MYEDDFLEAAYEERFELPADEDDNWNALVDYGDDDDDYTPEEADELAAIAENRASLYGELRQAERTLDIRENSQD